MVIYHKYLLDTLKILKNKTIIDTWNFQELILHRIHEILLVASPYDAFILEEDGELTEQILHEYMGMNLSYAPRVWRASTAKTAIKMIERRKFDLIIVMIRISDMDPLSLGKRIKKTTNISTGTRTYFCCSIQKLRV